MKTMPTSMRSQTYTHDPLRGWAIFSAFVFLVCAGLLLSLFVAGKRADYRYQQAIGSNWTLADRASTIDQKSAYIDKFVAALDTARLASNNALIYPTPENATASNIEAIKSLQTRLHQVQKMAPTSFEYQTAIQQITAQEQGEAHAMLDDIVGAWQLANGYWFIWGWVGTAIAGFLMTVGGLCGLIFFAWLTEH